jgi:RNA binding activity-knot of a chromodomain
MCDVTPEDSDSVVRYQVYSGAESAKQTLLVCGVQNPQHHGQRSAAVMYVRIRRLKVIIMSSPSVEGPSPQGNKKKKIKTDDGSGPGGGRISANPGSLLAGGSRKALNASPSTTSGGAPGSASQAASQDTHPYARGSVIEVWHYSRKDDWWSEPDTSDEEQGDGGSHRTARLCDVIDRANVNNAWRYYVHYRDFNRRMDEWIGTDRIVSPPSIGNAKVRALKKKKQKASHGHGQAAVVGSPAGIAVASAATSTPSNATVESDVAGPRSRRRTSLLQDATSSVPDDALPDAASAGGSTAGGAVSKTPVPAGSEAVVSSGSAAGSGPKAGGGPGGRRRRQSSRRKLDDDATVVTSNATDGDPQAGSASSQLQPPQLKNNIKSQQIVLSDAMTTHTVGEHVVATVHAQELDEHEGLDEASLREHEEVTKVKNVNFLELGEFQMETWYV